MHQTRTMNDEDLRLQGDKIKLESRPVSRETSTASAKCAYLLQGPQRSARPVSAVPMLSLYENNKDDYQLTQKLRRPYSADHLNVIGSRHERVMFKEMNSNRMDKFTNSYSSLQSIEEIDKDSLSSLPSSELLKTLIDEPIVSWRRRSDHHFVVDSPDSEESRRRISAKMMMKRDTCSSSKDDLIASDNSLPNDPDTPSARVESANGCQPVAKKRERDAIAMSAELTPGLKSKPPLPPPPPPPATPLLQSNSQHVHGAKQTENKHHRQIAHQPSVDEQKWINEMLVDEIDLEEEVVEENAEAQTNFYLEQIKGMNEQHADLDSAPNKVNTTNVHQQLCDDPIKRKENMCDTELLLDKLREEQQRLLEQKIKQQEKELGLFHENAKSQTESCGQDSAKEFVIPEVTYVNNESDKNDKFERFFGEPIRTTRSETIITLEFPQTLKEKQQQQAKLKKQQVQLRQQEPMRSQNSVKFEPKRNNFSAKDIKKTSRSAVQANISSKDEKLGCVLNAKNQKPKFLAKPMKAHKSDQDYEKIKVRQIDDTESWMSKTNGSATPSTSSSITPVGSSSQETTFASKSTTSTVTSSDIMISAKTSSEKTSDCDLVGKLDDIKITDALTDEECDLANDEGWDSDHGNTCEEIEAILEVLEQESQKSNSQIESIKKIVSHELNASINSIPSKSSGVQQQQHNLKMKSASKTATYNLETQETHVRKEDIGESTVNGKRLDIQKGPQSNNFNEILTFLDEVERSNAQTISIAQDRIDLSNQLISNAMRLDTIPKLEDLLNYSQVELANQVIDLNLRLKDKSSSIKVLQDELSNLRDLAMKTQKHTEKLVKDKLKAQKDESDSVIKRHQKFIDQLMSDKKTLNEQCEGLLREMKCLDEKFTNNFKAIEHKHSVELKKAKEMHLAGEKIRRERWIDTKTQKIKELTVKSIEPELQAMTMRHERELSDLRALHKHEIEDIEMTHARKSQQQLEALREQLTNEREKTLIHEREMLRVRYESMIEAEEKSYQEQRKRLMHEQTVRYAECETREQAAYAERDKVVLQAKEECEESARAMEMKHMRTIDIIKENAEMECEKWKCAWKKQQEVVLAKKDDAMKEQYRKERDREIECVIERLEREMQNTRIQIDIATDTRICRLKEKYENEIKDLEASESQYKEKFTKAKAKLMQNDELIESLQASIRHLEGQVTHTSQMYLDLDSEQKHIRETVREEMKYEMTQLQRQVDKVKHDRDTELSQVYGRVKVAVARKDEMLAELSRDHVALKEKCKYMEKMLEQQRKELLMR